MPAQTSLPVTVGTPLSDSATRVLLLGSGELGKELAISFQRYGVEVIAVDRYANAPAHQVAHRSHVIDMTDRAALLRLIETERPTFVIPEIEAIATETLRDIEDAGLAEVIPTARATELTMDREGIRVLADQELGLPTSPYVFADSKEQLLAGVRQFGYPCVVKPVMSSSGKGQTVVREPGDAETAWERAIEGARVAKPRVIVEGFIEFDYEITLLTVRWYDAENDELVTSFCPAIGHRQVGGDYVESWQPEVLSPLVRDTARSIAARIVTALGDGKLGGRGIFGVELFVKGDDVYFSEVSPRPHDTGLVTLVSQRLSEFDLHARAILGFPLDTTLASPGASAVLYGRIGGEQVGYAGLAQALAIPETEVRIFGKPESFPRRRMGVALATGDDVAQARRRARGAASAVTVVDTAVRPAPPDLAKPAVQEPPRESRRPTDATTRAVSPPPRDGE